MLSHFLSLAVVTLCWSHAQGARSDSLLRRELRHRSSSRGSKGSRGSSSGGSVYLTCPSTASSSSGTKGSKGSTRNLARGNGKSGKGKSSSGSDGDCDCNPPTDLCPADGPNELIECGRPCAETYSLCAFLHDSATRLSLKLVSFVHQYS